LSGVSMAAHTRRAGALNVRVRTMVVSVGVGDLQALGIHEGSL
jgi:hypothetical protein